MKNVSSNEIIALAASISIAITSSSSDQELQTVINLFAAVQYNLAASLEQRSINKKVDSSIEPVLPIAPVPVI